MWNRDFQRTAMILLTFAVVATQARVVPTGLLPAHDSNVTACGTRPHLTDCELYAMYLNDKEHQEDPSDQRRQLLKATNYAFRIPVYVHSIAGSDGKGHIKKRDYRELKLAMNKAFKKNGPFQFDFRPINKVNEDRWKSCSYSAIREFKFELRVGGRDSLNIYICDPRGTGLLGFSTFPQDAVVLGKPNEARFDDGVVLANPSLPLRILGVYARREVYYTLPHEVGHWLGLLHTFSGGCGEHPVTISGITSRGDGVKDTSPHDGPSWNMDGWDTCFADRPRPQGNTDPSRATKPFANSCPDTSSEPDPVNNFMNYIHEDCMMKKGEFTEGQIARMFAQFVEYRHLSGAHRERRRQLRDRGLFESFSEEDFIKICGEAVLKSCHCDPNERDDCDQDCALSVVASLGPYQVVQDETGKKLGEPCWHGETCRSGGYCVLGFCSECQELFGACPNNEVCTFKQNSFGVECQPKKGLTQPCFAKQECEDHLFCHGQCLQCRGFGDTGSCSRYGQGHWCDFDMKCKPPRGRGSFCTNDGMCGNGLVCASAMSCQPCRSPMSRWNGCKDRMEYCDMNFNCVRSKDEGATCNGNSFNSFQCGPGLSCSFSFTSGFSWKCSR